MLAMEVLLDRGARERAPDLGARLAAGEREAFDELVRGAWESVMRYFWKRTAPEDARDLAQRTFAEAWQSVRAGRMSVPATLEEWRRYLLVCARNRWIDAARRNAAREPAASLDALLVDGDERARFEPEAPHSDPALERDLASAVRGCLELLEPLWRSACWLHFVDGVSKREIARSLGKPEATVRLQFDAQLGALKRCLEGKGALP
jgi:RNA polymerase sigma factor (sigma-70 family)